MATYQRTLRIDENVANEGASNTAKLQALKMDPRKETKRAALSEILNKVKSTETDLNLKDNPLKDAKLIQNFKHIKPKVDSHWRKPTISSSSQTTVVNEALKKEKGVLIKKSSLDTEDKTKSKITRVIKAPVRVSEKNAVALKPTDDNNIARKQLTKIPSMLRKNSSSSSSTTSLDSEPKSISAKSESHSSKLLCEIEDIDRNDDKNPFLVSEYVTDIYNYLRVMEKQYRIGEDFLKPQAEITHRMRSVLVDWINEVHFQFRLEIETYHMTVSIIDRYLQAEPMTSRQNLQLVGVTALFIASKYEELYPPEIGDFVYITDETYNKSQILEMERRIIKKLKFELGKPLSIHFLRRFSKAAKADTTHAVAKYFIELATIEYSLCQYRPSEIAAASLYLAIKLFPERGMSSWNYTLQFYSKYTSDHLMPIVRILAQIVKNASQSKQKAIYTKYSVSKYLKISLKPELSSGLIERFIQ